MNKDQVQEILETLPPASQNNDRSIFLEKVKRFEKSPSDRNRIALEEFGMSIDKDDYIDHGGQYAVEEARQEALDAKEDNLPTEDLEELE